MTLQSPGAAAPAPASKPPLIPPAPAPAFNPANQQQFNAGFSSGIQMSSGKSEALDRELSGLSEQKAQQEAILRANVQNSFLKALEREKQPRPSAGCGSGGDYQVVLFDDSVLTVRYTLTTIDRRSCTYTNTSREVIPFCGYYYKATCTVTNKSGRRVGLRGYVSGSPSPEPKKHISVHGDIGACFGFDKNPDTFWNNFYVSWNGELPAGEHVDSGYFWTEIQGERPAWELNYVFLQ
ncbi:hypothetical protein ACWKWU_01020 [Chitinophaga lutea]